jgi:hypothetical protein
MSAKIRDRLGSILMLAFVGALWVQRDYITPFGGIFPDIVMVGLALLGVLTLILSFTPWPAIKEEAPKKEKNAKINWTDMVIVALILLAWTGLLRYAGFALSGVVGFGTISWYLSERRSSPRVILTCFGIALAITYLLIYVFEHLLLVPLPVGKLFE